VIFPVLAQGCFDSSASSLFVLCYRKRAPAFLNVNPTVTARWLRNNLQQAQACGHKIVFLGWNQNRRVENNMSKSLRLVVGLLLFSAVLVVSAWGQGIYGTITGVVSDPSQSVVGSAKVTLRDASSGSQRDTVTNGDGYYTFASVPVGSYTLSVEAPGFQGYKADDIRLGGGEHRNVNVTLAVGKTTDTVEVTAEQDFAVATVDSGEKSFALGTKELQNFTQVGSNAAEYIKIVPGFGISNGTQNKSNYNGQTIGINANGDSGSQSPLNAAFSYNGLPTNTLDIVADGAHVSDPGCNCDTPVNPNSDFLQEFKVLTSNFGAENQKGPVVITSVTKAGGSQFHGNGFFSARNYALNASDWLLNSRNVAKPQNKYYYPGGSIGGPVIIPGTGFNKNRDKLFFFAGFEYFYQVLDTGLLSAIVPTPAEINGDFSAAEVAKEGSGGHALNTNGLSTFGGTQVPAGLIDPNMQALMKLYPAPNSTPTSASPFNYNQAEVFNQNNRQFTTRVDYNVSDSTKVFVRYNYQREVQQFPVGLWWRQSDQVPYPSPIEGKNKSDSITGTITHVFSPTMTNEVVMAYTFVGFPNVFANPSKVSRSTVGFTYPGLFNNGVAQIPSFGGSGGSGEAALVFNPGGFEAGGASSGLYANKYMPSISDTLTKVIKTHTIKAGFFYEWIRNAQPANNNTNGYMQFVPSSNVNSYGNAYADMLTGNMSNYNETNFNRINDISYNTVEWFVQDSWKVRKKLTLELGLRLTHFSPWVDDENFGYSIFNTSLYNPTCAAAPTYCGFQWHAKSHAVPLGGFPTRAVFYQPRVGAAYDLFGNGNTVLRGGWGRFYYHSGQFTSGLDASAGSATVTLTPQTAGPVFAKNLATTPFTATPAAPAAVDSKDDRQPYTDSWSFTVSQRAPLQSLVEVAYVGNRSRDLPDTGGALSNINLVPLGAMLTASNPATADPNLYRPLDIPNPANPGHALGYGDLNLNTNGLYSNYNALQATWGRHAGRYTIQANYTWQKALGIVTSTHDGQPNGAASINPFNLRSNYGIQPTDRRQLFNIAYSIDIGNPLHAHGFLAGATAGWQISGITQLQSGANLTFSGGYNASSNYNLTLNNAIIPGSVSTTNTKGIQINNQSILGTNAVQLNPLVTCNPNSGLGSHQYVNGSCFAAPTVPGQNGPTLLPVSYGPAYFNTDLGLFKNFQITESKRLQFRIQAYNFVNHPLWSFPDNSNLTLNFSQDPTTGAITQTNANFGKATSKQGARVLELAMKFYF
jgi:Carboxypeptidase regulatory-like domain